MFLKRIYKLLFTLDFYDSRKAKVVLPRMDELRIFESLFSPERLSQVVEMIPFGVRCDIGLVMPFSPVKYWSILILGLHDLNPISQIPQ